MLELSANWQSALAETPWLHTTIMATGLLLISWLANLIVKNIIIRSFYRFLAHKADPRLSEFGLAKRLSNIVPALIISAGVQFIPNTPEWVIEVVRNVSNSFIILTVVLALGSLLNLINYLYQSRNPEKARTHPIKGYIQVLKILLYAIATILIVATLIDRSPLILLSGLGAMAAVLMLIFQDTILSLVASVQISSNDMIRVGDWVEMPGQNADGDVIDIALHTVRIQNFDKTITTIPTKRFITDAFKNWRGMQESGGRRIKRSINIDQQSIRFLTADEVKELAQFDLLKEYLEEKSSMIHDFNQKVQSAGKDEVNKRRLTNIGTFRAYIDQYLRHNPGIHQNMTLMVRQLSPTSEGLPLELYCFTNTTAWVAYENTMGDIFDHLLAILPEFGLRVFQNPSGSDFRALKEIQTPH